MCSEWGCGSENSTCRLIWGKSDCEGEQRNDGASRSEMAVPGG